MNSSDKPKKEKMYRPIISPKIGNKKAIAITPTIAIVMTIAIKRATKNDRSSVTLYARLNAFVIALTPFDADQSVPIILIDKRLPRWDCTRLFKFDSRS